MKKAISKTAPSASPPTKDESDAVGSQLLRAPERHGYVLMAAMYETQLKAVVGEDAVVLESAQRYAIQLLNRFKPRDVLEELLFAQMLQTHARVNYLNAFAAQQSNLKWGGMMHEAADRASNTFRRQMLALAEYRNPKPPARTSVTQIGQANIAQQQVVQQVTKEGAKNATNEQGSPNIVAANQQAAKALPVVEQGTGSFAGDGSAGAAVGEEQRTADQSRQGDRQQKCPTSRTSIRRSGGRAKGRH